MTNVTDDMFQTGTTTAQIQRVHVCDLARGVSHVAVVFSAWC